MVNAMWKTSGRIDFSHNASNSLSLGSRSPAWLLVIRWPGVGLWPAGKTNFNYHRHHEFKISMLYLPWIRNTWKLQVTSPIRSSANFLEHRAFLDWIMNITVQRNWVTKTRVNWEQTFLFLTAFAAGSQGGELLVQVSSLSLPTYDFIGFYWGISVNYRIYHSASKIWTHIIIKNTYIVYCPYLLNKRVVFFHLAYFARLSELFPLVLHPVQEHFARCK